MLAVLRRRVYAEQRRRRQKMSRILKRIIEGFVLGTNGVPAFRKAYEAVYVAGLNLVVSRIKRYKEIKAICSRRSMVSGKWAPGYSDIDLFVLIDEMEPDAEKNFLKSFWKKYNFWKRYLPFLGEVQVSTAGELNDYAMHGDIRALEIKNNWKILYGSKLNVPEYLLNERKHKMDVFNEMLKSYHYIVRFFWLDGLKNSRRESHIYKKAFADMSKTAGGFINGGDVAAGGDVEAGVEVAAGGDVAVSGDVTASGGHERAYVSAILLLDNYAKRLSKEIFIGYDEGFKIRSNQNWKEMEDTINNSDGLILSVIQSHSREYTYVVLKDGITPAEIRGVIGVVKDRRKREPAFFGPPPFLVTRSAFECVANSLHLETASNYYSLVLSPNVIIGEVDGIRKIDRGLFLLLLKECLVNAKQWQRSG